VGRFDRQHTEARDLPAILGSAAEEFRTSVEREVRAVLEAAQHRAYEIEHQAEFNATQREQLSEHRAKEIVESVFNRASRVLDSIDLVEGALSGMLTALREELESLAPPSLREGGGNVLEERAPATDRETAMRLPEALTPAGPTATPPREEQAPSDETTAPEEVAPPGDEGTDSHEPKPEPVAEEPEPESLHEEPEQPVSEKPEPLPAEPAPAVEDQPLHEEAATPQDRGWPRAVPLGPEAGRTPELDQMVRQQLRKMFAAGKSRSEAERFLERFHFAGDYAVALDEIYGEPGQNHPPRRQGFFARLRRSDR
jgi:outer membrane biosynthesis protein TonB